MLAMVAITKDALFVPELKQLNDGTCSQGHPQGSPSVSWGRAWKIEWVGNYLREEEAVEVPGEVG
jgi:hypothetical protein